MDIISRNFFRLLRAGAFDEEEQIEPMSAWKWRRTYQYALMHGVSALLYDGIEKCSDQFFMQLQPELADAWRASTNDIEQESRTLSSSLTRLYQLLNRQQLRPMLTKGLHMASLYKRPEHRSVHAIEIFFPFETQGKKADLWARDNGTHHNEAQRHTLCYQWNNLPVEHQHRLYQLTNRLLNRTLQNIIEAEIRENEPNYITIDNTRMEVTTNALAMLHVILDIAHSMLNNGISVQQLTDLGIMLRQAGNKTDFVKLQNWIDKLGLKRIAQTAGQLLIELLGFSSDEIPFMSAGKESNLDPILRELFLMRNDQQAEWSFQQGQDIFVHSTNSSAMMWQTRHSLSNFRYYPAEGITNFFTTFTHSLSHIEE
jgi:hypothetical protein